MSPLEFAGLKQTLCRYFADKRVKVSLFLQDGIQKQDGAIPLVYSGPLPPFAPSAAICPRARTPSPRRRLRG